MEAHSETVGCIAALQIADCKDAHVQSALIAARISNYGCHNSQASRWPSREILLLHLCVDRLHFVMMH